MSPSPAHLRRSVLALPFCAILAVTAIAAADNQVRPAAAEAPASAPAAPLSAGQQAPHPQPQPQAIAEPQQVPAAAGHAPRTVRGRADTARQPRAAYVVPAHHPATRTTQTQHRTTPTHTATKHTATKHTRTTEHTQTKPAATTKPAVKHAPASGTTSGSSNSSIAHAVLSQLNRERARHNRPALHMNSRLISSAHAHNLEMAAHNQMSHRLPGEAAFTTRISRAGYSWHACGENVGWNSTMSTSGALALETMMYNEGPGGGHYENIVSGKYRDVGVDVYLDNTHHKLWLTVDFGG